MATKEKFMRLAIELAQATVGQTSPNPAVGCVVVKDGKVVGVGAHLQAGQAHAEVNALRAAGEHAEGADMYLTLEPCAHVGKTPPCVDLIIQKNIRYVSIASLDPNPQVAGKGVAKLKKAGISVEVGLCEQEAIALNKYFFHYIKTKKPYVTLKTAVTMDGKTASFTGDSKWITSESARLDVHQYRHEHDAILVGVNTIIQDNPRLTTRLPRGGKNPIRIILDTQLRVPLQTNVITDQEATTIIICGQHACEQKERQLEQLGVHVKRMPTEKIDIVSLLSWLGTKNITSVFVEGGATVHASFLASGCFQQVIMYMAPKLLGGHNAYPSFGGEGRRMIADSSQLQFTKVEMIGPDVKLIAEPILAGGDTNDVHRDY